MNQRLNIILLTTTIGFVIGIASDLHKTKQEIIFLKENIQRLDTYISKEK